MICAVGALSQSQVHPLLGSLPLPGRPLQPQAHAQLEHFMPLRVNSSSPLSLFPNFNTVPSHICHTHTRDTAAQKKLRLRCQKYTIYNYITVVLPTTVALSSLQPFKCLICCGNRRHPPLGSGPVSSPTWPPICVCFRKSKQHKNVASHEF